MNKLSLYLVLLTSLILSGCPSENELLVNPEPVTKSVRIRVLNLSRADYPLSFRFDGEVTTEDIGYGEVTQMIVPPDVPPYDSLLFEAIGPQGDVVFTPPVRPRLFRNLDYTYIVLPSLPNDSVQADIRRVLTSQTTPGIRTENRNSYLKVISGIDTEGVSVSIKDGCQSGQQLVTSSGLGLPSTAKEIPPGERIISVVLQSEQNGLESIGTYSLELEEQGQYIVLVLEDAGTPTGYRVQLLDEEDELSNLTNLQELSQNSLSIRVANIGDEGLITGFNSFDNAFGDIAANSLTEYRVFGACNSINPDTLRFNYGNRADSIFYTYSLNVEQKYTVVNIADNRQLDENGIAATTPLLIAPLPLTYQRRAGFATVRVVNALPGDIGLTLSVASNSKQVQALSSDLNQAIIDRNYVGGQSLANSLRFGRISGTSDLAPGELPLTLFTSSNPAQLLNSYIYDFAPDKDYIVFIYGDNNDPKISIIDEESSGGELTVPTQGMPVQIINAEPNETTATINLLSADGYSPLSDARLAYTNTISTILPLGDATVEVNGTTQQINLEKGRRVFLVNTSNDLLAYNESKMNPTGRSFQFKLINAAPTSPSIVVKDVDDERPPYFDPISYGGITNAAQSELPNAFVFYVYNSDTGELISTNPDIPLDFYKSYYLILAENDSDTQEDPDEDNYSLIIAQEF